MYNCSEIQLLGVTSYLLTCKYTKLTKETVLMWASAKLRKKKNFMGLQGRWECFNLVIFLLKCQSLLLLSLPKGESDKSERWFWLCFPQILPTDHAISEVLELNIYLTFRLIFQPITSNRRYAAHFSGINKVETISHPLAYYLFPTDFPLCEEHLTMCLVVNPQMNRGYGRMMVKTEFKSGKLSSLMQAYHQIVQLSLSRGRMIGSIFLVITKIPTVW